MVAPSNYDQSSMVRPSSSLMVLLITIWTNIRMTHKTLQHPHELQIETLAVSPSNLAARAKEARVRRCEGVDGVVAISLAGGKGKLLMEPKTEPKDLK